MILAVLTCTKNLQLVAPGLETVPRDDLVLKPLQFRAEKFNCPVTLCADDVMVVRAVIEGLKSGPAILQVGLTRQSAKSQGL